MNLDQMRMAAKMAKALGLPGSESIEDAAGALQSGRKQMTARALGLEELLSKPFANQDFRNNLANAQKENLNSEEGEGVPGFMGSVAGDPMSYLGGGLGKSRALEAKLAEKLTPKAVKLAQLISGGTATGALSGATEGTQDPNSSLLDNAENALKGAGIGAAISVGIPAVAGAAKMGSDLASGIYDRAASALGSKTAPYRVANNVYAKYLLGNGISPGQIPGIVGQSAASPLSPTLGELTQSPKILGVEKNLSKGDDIASQNINDFFVNRADNTIPQAFLDKAASLAQSGSEASGLYNKAYGETPTSDAQQKAFNDIQSMMQDIKTKLQNKGAVSDIPQRALQKAQTTLDNASKRGNTIEALHDAKKELSDLFIEGADGGSKAQANSITYPYAKKIDENLANMAPENFKAGDIASQQGQAAQDLQDAVSTTREGGLRQMYNKTFATPEQQQDFLSKVPEADRPQFEQFFDELKKVSRGHADSGTAYNMVSNQNLANDTRGFDSSITQFAPNLIDKVTGSYTAPIREAMAGLSQNPSNSIYNSMVKKAQSILDNPNLANAISLSTIKADQPSGTTDSSVFDNHEELPAGFQIQPQHQALPAGFVIQGVK